MDDGSIKLYLTQRTLFIRNSDPALFQQGSYIPLEVRGNKANHVCAFAREYEGRMAIVTAPRLCATLLGDTFEAPCADELWEDTELEIPRLAAPCVHNAFTGECIMARGNGSEPRLALGGILRDFPVGLLLSEQLPV